MLGGPTQEAEERVKLCRATFLTSHCRATFNDLLYVRLVVRVCTCIRGSRDVPVQHHVVPMAPLTLRPRGAPPVSGGSRREGPRRRADLMGSNGLGGPAKHGADTYTCAELRCMMGTGGR